MKWVKSHLIFGYLFCVTYVNNWRQFIQLKSLFQNEIVNFYHLMLMVNLSPITLIKLFLFFVALRVAFSSSLKHAYIVHCFQFVFNFVLDVLIAVLHQEFIWLRLKLTFSCFSLWISYYFVIESLHAFYFFNNVVVYKALLV